MGSIRTNLFPVEFESRFLRGMGHAFRRRSKAIRYGSGLFIYSGVDDGYEWFSVAVTGGVTEVTLHLWEGNRGNLFLRSTRSRRGFKILFRLERMLLVDNGYGVTSAFEDTLSLASWEERVDRDLQEAIESVWDDVRLRV